MLYMIIQAARSLLAAFFMSLKVTFQNLSLSGVIPIGFFVLLGLLILEVLFSSLNPDLVSVTFCRICNRSKGHI